MDLNTADKVLKVFYLPPIQEQLNNATILLSRFEKDSTTQVGGKSFTVPLHVSRNQAAGVGRAELGALPTAGAQGYENAVIPNKYIYGRITVSGPVLRATRSSAMAFIKAIQSEIQGCLKDTQRAVNRQLHGDGIDALGYYVSGAGTTSGVFDDNLGNSFVHVSSAGTLVDLLDASSSYAVLDSAQTYTAGADVATGVAITASGNINAGAADGDPCVVSGTKDRQMMGIAGIISDANPPLLSGGLHGLTVASNPWWKSQVIGDDASKQDLSVALMQKVMSKIASSSDASEKDVKLLVCSYQMRDKYVELCVNERRFYNTMTLDGGFEAVSFNNKPLVPDAQCRHNRIYFIVPDTFAIFRSSDFEWMSEDGAVLSRVSGVDGYEAILFHYGDLGCRSRNSNGLLRGINE